MVNGTVGSMAGLYLLVAVVMGRSPSPILQTISFSAAVCAVLCSYLALLLPRDLPV